MLEALAEHFPRENVRKNVFGAAVFSRSENKGSAKMYLVFCKNIFGA
jgi:hypothetical protein